MDFSGLEALPAELIRWLERFFGRFTKYKWLATLLAILLGISATAGVVGGLVYLYLWVTQNP